MIRRIVKIGGASALVVGLLFAGPTAEAGVLSKGVRESLEYIVKKFGKGAVREGLEKFGARLERLFVKYGDECLEAARKAGPRAVDAIEEAGPLGRTAAKCLARHGEEALKMATNRRALRLVSEFGDDAAEAIIRHPGIAEDLIASHGQAAAAVLKRLGSRQARRLVMMHKSGDLAKLGHHEELLDVIERYGDRAMDFVWKNKGKLAVAAVMVSFLANPEPYINGVKDLAEAGIDGAANVASTAVEAAGKSAAQTAGEVAARTNWTVVFITAIIVAGVIFWLRSYRLLRRSTAAANSIQRPQ